MEFFEAALLLLTVGNFLIGASVWYRLGVLSERTEGHEDRLEKLEAITV